MLCEEPKNKHDVGRKCGQLFSTILVKHIHIHIMIPLLCEQIHSPFIKFNRGGLSNSKTKKQKKCGFNSLCRNGNGCLSEFIHIFRSMRVIMWKMKCLMFLQCEYYRMHGCTYMKRKQKVNLPACPNWQMLSDGNQISEWNFIQLYNILLWTLFE